MGLFAALLIIETGFRFYLLNVARTIDDLRKPDSAMWGHELTLFHIVQPGADERRVYELAPGAHGTFARQPLRINSAGFRDRERPAKKQAGVFRMAVLGDSVAFGCGVRAEDRLSDILERFLNEYSPAAGTQYECLNFAAPGYNTVMELATLRDCALQYSPDAVILVMVNNDDELPNFVRVAPQVWSLRKLFVIEAIRDFNIGRVLGDTARIAAGGIAETGGAGAASHVKGFRPELVPPEYQFLMGRDKMTEALRGIVAETSARGIPALCIMPYPKMDVILDAPASALSSNYNTEWFEAARQAGFVTCDPAASLAWYLKRHQLRERAFWAGERDFHPNAIAHAILARNLWQCLVQKRLLPDSGQWERKMAECERAWDMIMSR